MIFFPIHTLFQGQKIPHLESWKWIRVRLKRRLTISDINQQQYGLERLCEIVRRNSWLSVEEIRQAVIADVRQRIGSQKVLDDITLLVLKQK